MHCNALPLAITIVSVRRTSRQGVNNLLCRPFHAWTRCDIEMQNAPPVMRENEQDEQDSEILRRFGLRVEILQL